MATAQPMVSTSEYEETIDEYFPRPCAEADDDFQQPPFVFTDQKKSKVSSSKSKPRKNKRSGKQPDSIARSLETRMPFANGLDSRSSIRKDESAYRSRTTKQIAVHQMMARRAEKKRRRRRRRRSVHQPV